MVGAARVVENSGSGTVVGGGGEDNGGGGDREKGDEGGGRGEGEERDGDNGNDNGEGKDPRQGEKGGDTGDDTSDEEITEGDSADASTQRDNSEGRVWARGRLVTRRYRPHPRSSRCTSLYVPVTPATAPSSPRPPSSLHSSPSLSSLPSLPSLPSFLTKSAEDSEEVMAQDSTAPPGLYMSTAPMTAIQSSPPVTFDLSAFSVSTILGHSLGVVVDLLTVLLTEFLLVLSVECKSLEVLRRCLGANVMTSLSNTLGSDTGTEMLSVWASYKDPSDRLCAM